MAGPFYFKWVGGAIDPAFTLETTGDLWSGTLETTGDLWNGTLSTTADTTKDSTTLTNLGVVTSLRIGKTYTVTGSGLDEDATFVYEGGFDVVMSFAASTSGTSVGITITNTPEAIIVANLDLLDGLISGKTYKIAATGIPYGSTFVYDGSTTLTLSGAATVTEEGVSLKITLAEGQNVITNVADKTGLIDGQVYSVSGIGVAGAATFTYDASATDITMYQNATESGTGVSLVFSKGATEDNGGAFDVSLHAFEDEQVLSVDISQAEGNFAQLKIGLKNPRIGLLAPTRQRWCWLSWFNGVSIVPLFHGRIWGAPEAMAGEAIEIKFVARPNNFSQQQETIARTLRTLPNVDPVWISPDKVLDPNTVFETRTELWDTDRITLQVSAMDIIAGDTTIELLESDHIYKEVGSSIGEAPLRQVTVIATVTWQQEAEGDVDLTDRIVSEFQASGSPYSSPIVGSLTGDGLLNTWPKAGVDIGGGWSMGLDALAEEATWVGAKASTKRFAAKDDSTTGSGAISVTGKLTSGSTAVESITPTTSLTAGTYDISNRTGIPTDTTINITISSSSGSIESGTLGGLTIPNSPTTTASGVLSNAATEDNSSATLSLTKKTTSISSSGLQKGYKNYDLLLTAKPISVYFPVHYNTSRDRSETVIFTLTADTQPILADAEGADVEVIKMSSDLVGQAVDLDGTIPIGDVARNAFFPLDRGIQSIEFLLLMAATKMRMRARAVKIKIRAPWAVLAEVINCRAEILFHDRRWPTGQVIGKVIDYSLKFIGTSGGMTAEATIGCTVGTGVELVTATPGVDKYATDYADGYTERTGAQVDVLDGVLQYASIDGTYVIDDDGVDFFNMTIAKCVKSLKIIGGATAQHAAIDAAASIASKSTDVADALKALPTRVALQLVPVDGGAFKTNYVVKPSKLVIPKTIDLEAVS